MKYQNASTARKTIPAINKHLKNLDNNKVKQAYEPLISNFRSSSLIGEIAVGIAPIQTLGNVRFSHYNCSDNIPEACFVVSKHDNGSYAPENVEQIIFYMLNFVLNQHLLTDVKDLIESLRENNKSLDYYMNNRSKSRRFLDSIFNLDGDKRDDIKSISNAFDATDKKLFNFCQSIKKVTDKCKTDKDGFEVIQGAELFVIDTEYSHKEEPEPECEY